MREGLLGRIRETVSELCKEANYSIREDVFEALSRAKEMEKEKLPRAALAKLIENVKIAREEKIPLCQDTGVAEVFLEIGKGVEIEGSKLEKAVYQGVREGYREGYLRCSVVDDPLFSRKNTRDNTPPLVHFLFTPSFRDKIKITVFPKGFGSENMGRAAMLLPGAGRKGVKEFILSTVKEAGANPCPPVVVGIGIGGTMETCISLAKRALLRPIGMRNPDKRYALLEEELLREINELRIGVQGLGGITTCLGVNIEHFPTHIAGLPVGVNISCYALRQASKVVE